MQIYQERRRLRRFIHSRIVIYALSFFAIFLLISSLRMIYTAYKASQARKIAEAEYQSLEDQKARLDKKIVYLENDEALEKEAKNRFNVTAPGEKVLIIVDRVPSGLHLEARPQSAWQTIKNFFKRSE